MKMFKVPDWGNDVPKNDVELTKLFAKKNKRTSIKGHINTNNKINGKVDNIHGIGKHKNKVSKINHIKKRKLDRNHNKLNAEPNYSKNSESSSSKDELLQRNRSDIKKPDLNNKEKVKNKEQNIQKSNQKNIVQDSPETISENKKIKKRKQTQNITRPQFNIVDSVDIQSYNTDEPNKVLVNAKRKKLNDKLKNDDIEDVLFESRDIANKKKKNQQKTDQSSEKSNIESLHEGKLDNVREMSNIEIKRKKKKAQLKEILIKNRTAINTNGNKLRMRMLERLKAAQFRYINEKLYTSTGAESQELFKSNPTAFQAYHEGYQQQVKKWPVNPLDLIAKRIHKMPKTHIIADMGCGEAALSNRVEQRVRSFDLVAVAPGVEACDMAHTPLLAASVDVVVYCLALMGTDLTLYLLEANRVLKMGGYLLIAEVESRFENAETFSSDVQRLGFSLKKMDKSHKVFFFMEFSKVRDAPAKKHKLPILNLKPCLYKKR